MATLTKQVSTVYGNERKEVWKIEMNEATVTALQTGLQNITSLNVNVLTATATSLLVIPNKGAAGTAIAGTVAITSAISGADVLLTVYGV
jgi:hypothetical protein